MVPPEDENSGSMGKKDGKNGRVDKQLEIRQQKRFLFLEQLRIREAMKNGEFVEGDETVGRVAEEQRAGQESGGEEKGGEECIAAEQFSEEAVVSFMKQLGWSEGEDIIDDGLTEEELLGVLPLDAAQLSQEREKRKEFLAQSLRQWQPSPKSSGTTVNASPSSGAQEDNGS